MNLLCIYSLFPCLLLYSIVLIREQFLCTSVLYSRFHLLSACSKGHCIVILPQEQKWLRVIVPSQAPSLVQGGNNLLMVLAPLAGILEGFSAASFLSDHLHRTRVVTQWRLLPLILCYYPQCGNPFTGMESGQQSFHTRLCFSHLHIFCF